ncbi:MAG: hypothetical protein VB126_03220, partial [Paludibacter sp.]|nr:hypothetical protein [Paludibacter sp.]
MKNIYKSFTKILLSIVTLGALVFLPACNDNPDEYVITDGVPVVKYVRMPDVVSADSLVTHAFMGNTIAIVGENLTSVKELWFNDQKTVLNSSLITSNVLITSVPTKIPNVVTNKMYLINKSNDTIKVDFGVDVPSPLLSSMKCEYVADGGVAVIRGNYFLSVAGINQPEVIFTPNIKATEIVSYNLNEIRV